MKELVKTNKLSANFGAAQYEVVKISGGEVIIRADETGKEYRRNTTHVKKVPETKHSTPAPDPVEEEEVTRPRREIKKPERLGFSN